MAKTSGELEKEFIQNAKAQTGKTLEQWLSLVKSFGLGKQKEIIEVLRKDHGLNYMQGQFVAGIFLNQGKPVFSDESSLLENQFAKCPDMKSLFEEISSKIIDAFPGTQLIPKKTYLSLTASREFAAFNAKPGEIRMGLDLGTEPFSGKVSKTKLTGPMPRISHMLVFTAKGQFDKASMALVKKSYDRTHVK